MSKARMLARRQVLTCSACELRQECRKPVPFSGPSPADLAVLGEAPGRMEDRIGEPFVGPSGHLLKETLEAAAVDPDTVMRFNAASCWPSRSGTPGKAHLAACRPNLEIQVAVSAARVVLVVGATALSAVTPYHRISEVRGRRMWWGVGNGRVVVPTWHPAAVLRDPGKRRNFSGDVGTAARLVRQVAAGGWSAALGGWDEDCWRCGGELERYDEVGLGLCGEHAAGLPEPRGVAVGRRVQGQLEFPGG